MDRWMVVDCDRFPVAVNLGRLAADRLAGILNDPTCNDSRRFITQQVIGHLPAAGTYRVVRDVVAETT